MRVGLYKDYYENGVLKKEEFYKNGKLEGVVKGYHRDGDLKFETSYSNGQLIEEIR